MICVHVRWCNSSNLVTPPKWVTLQFDPLLMAVFPTPLACIPYLASFSSNIFMYLANSVFISSGERFVATIRFCWFFCWDHSLLECEQWPSLPHNLHCVWPHVAHHYFPLVMNRGMTVGLTTLSCDHVIHIFSIRLPVGEWVSRSYWYSLNPQFTFDWVVFHCLIQWNIGWLSRCRYKMKSHSMIDQSTSLMNFIPHQ